MIVAKNNVKEKKQLDSRETKKSACCGHDEWEGLKKNGIFVSPIDDMTGILDPDYEMMRLPMSPIKKNKRVSL